MIPKEMQGVVLHGKEDIRFEPVPVPGVGRGEVLVKVERASTCGTDLKVFHRGGHARMLRPPTLFGHEFSGTIAQMNGSSYGFAAGQRVACHNSAPCNDCFYCRREHYSLCENLHFVNGAFAEYVTVPEPIARQNLLALPDHVSHTEACLMEPLSCVLHGIDRTRIHPADTVAVVGDGAIGQMFVWVLAKDGTRIIHVGEQENRLRVGREFGARHSVNHTEEADTEQAVRDLTEDGRGADVVIECTGKPEVWESCTRMVRPGGIVNLFGGCPQGTTFSVSTEALHYNEIEIIGIFHTTPKHVREALSLISSCPGELLPLLHDRLSLGELREAFKLMDERRAFRVSIEPGR